jgi:hypothetical protein
MRVCRLVGTGEGLSGGVESLGGDRGRCDRDRFRFGEREGAGVRRRSRIGPGEPHSGEPDPSTFRPRGSPRERGERGSGRCGGVPGAVEVADELVDDMVGEVLA